MSFHSFSESMSVLFLGKFVNFLKDRLFQTRKDPSKADVPRFQVGEAATNTPSMASLPTSARGLGVRMSRVGLVIYLVGD